MKKLISVILCVSIFMCMAVMTNITIMDATAIQRHIAKNLTLTDEQLALGDTDKDGKISVMDATAIQRYVAKLINKF